MTNTDPILDNLRAKQRTYDDLSTQAGEARAARDEVILDAMEAGHSRYRIAKTIGVSEPFLVRFQERFITRYDPPNSTRYENLDSFIAAVCADPMSTDWHVVDIDELTVRHHGRRQIEWHTRAGGHFDTVSLIQVARRDAVLATTNLDLGEDDPEKIRAAVTATLEEARTGGE